MRFDGPTLARAWLAVMAATGDDRNIGKTYKTIALEQHLRGLRLVASDSRLMLTAYVPDLDHHYDGTPDPEERAEQVHVVSDRNGRARSLLGHVLALSAETDPEAYAPGDIEVRVDFRQEHAHTRGSGPVQPTLEGMEPDYATLAVPGRERLNIEIVTDSFPDWRRVATHASKRSLGALLPPEQLEKLARIRKLARGPVEITMGDKTALVQYPESDPHIAGVLVLADPEDPDVYQGDRERPDDQPAPVDPDQTTIEDHIPDDLVDCPEKGCDYFADGSEDGDAALSDVVHHMAARHQVHDSTIALRRIHGLEDDPHGNPTTMSAGEAIAIAAGETITLTGEPYTYGDADEQRTAPDVMLRDAAELTVSTQLGSAAQLQRTLRIGQARASRLMDELERRGIVGPPDAGSGKSRAVLLRGDQVQEAIDACR
jgi:hypothetical protein